MFFARKKFAEVVQREKCNSGKCHCPACTDTKVEKLAERVSVLEAVGLAERERQYSLGGRAREQARLQREAVAEAERQHALSREQARLRFRREKAAGVNRIFYSKREGTCWRWVPAVGHRNAHYQQAWRRARCTAQGDLTGEYIDPVDRHISATEHTEHNKAGALETTVTDRIEFRARDYLNQCDAETEARINERRGWAPNAIPEWAAGLPITGETTMLKPNELAVLLWLAIYPGRSMTTSCPGERHDFRNALAVLGEKGLITYSHATLIGALTDRGKVFVEQGLCAVPLPVSKPATWTMPS